MGSAGEDGFIAKSRLFQERVRGMKVSFGVSYIISLNMLPGRYEIITASFSLAQVLSLIYTHSIIPVRRGRP